MGRLIAIGDIHGYASSLEVLIKKIDPGSRDTVVVLGDFVDRGPDSCGVIDMLINLSRYCRLISLLGNHDELFLSNLLEPEELDVEWLAFGGDTTLASYGRTLDDVPAEHIEFLQDCQDYYETDDFFFAHGSYIEDVPLADQPWSQLRWQNIRDRVPAPHCSGKRAILGHTAQRDWRLLVLPHLICLDTYRYGGGPLSAMDVRSSRVWHAWK